MFRKFRAALAAAGAAVLMATGFTAGAASAAPADAPEAWDDCAKGHVCMWAKTGFSGEKLVDWKPRHANGATYNLPASAAYRASSIRNNSDFHVMLANQRDGTGIGQKLVCAQSSWGDLEGFDNATRSMFTLHQCRPPVRLDIPMPDLADRADRVRPHRRAVGDQMPSANANRTFTGNETRPGSARK